MEIRSGMTTIETTFELAGLTHPLSVVVVQEEKNLLVGGGIKPANPDIFEQLRKFPPIDFVVIEHAHYDHYGIVEDLREEFGSEVAAHAEDVAALESAGIKVDHVLKHQDVFWGLIVIHVPGHTPGNISLLDEDARILLAGDTIFGRNFPYLPENWNLPLAPPPEVFDQNHEQAVRNISILLDYDFDKVVVAHGKHVLTNGKDEVRKLVDRLHEKPNL